MNLTLTDEGIKAIAENKNLNILSFVAGSSKSIEDMRNYLNNPSSYTGAYTYYVYPVDEEHTRFYQKGDSYDTGEGTIIVENNFLEVYGSLDCSLVPRSFAMRSLALLAKEVGQPSGETFIYAYGTISSADKPYPINSSDGITYITPVKIIYDNAPDVTTEESGVPWKNFIQHTDTYVSTSEGAHGLKIDPTAMTMTVGDTTISLAGGEERVAELEQEVQGILKYGSQDPVRPYNDQLVLTILSSADGDGTVDKPYKIRTPLDFWVVGTFKTDSNQFFYDSTVYPEGNDQSYYYPNENYQLENNLDLLPLIGIKKSVANGEVVEDMSKQNSNAPCYNEGRGYESWGITSHNSKFIGNNHFIKNLYIGPVARYGPNNVPNPAWNDQCHRRFGLFRRIGGEGCIISGINLVDSMIHAGSGYDCSVGSILSTTDNSSACQIKNCTSNADIVKENINNGEWGGIVGNMNRNLSVQFCAFHGTIWDFSGRQTSFRCGGIGGGNGGSNVVGCYCDANLDFRTTGSVGGIRGEWHPGTTDFLNGDGRYNGCYFAGYINSAESLSYPYKVGSITCQDGLTPDPTQLVPLKFTYSLQGSSAGVVQGNVRTREQMLSRDFVEELNNALPINSQTRYVYQEGSFPKLDYEVEAQTDSTPYSSPAATIDVSNNYVFNSGYTVRDLTQTATQGNLNVVSTALTSMLLQHTKTKVIIVTILSTDWDSGRHYIYYDDDVMYVSDRSRQILPIPSGQDFIDHFVTVNGAGKRQVNGVYRGYIEFQCTSIPSTDLTFPVIILSGTAVRS